MNKFLVVNSADEIKLSEKWVSSKEFKPDLIVDEYGNPPTGNYNGRLYKVVSSKERIFSPIERIGRGLLGVVAIILSLSIAYFHSDAVKSLFCKKVRIDFGVLIVKKKETPKPKEKPEEKIILPVDLNAPKGQFPVYVNTLTGYKYEISVQHTDTILELKQKIQELKGIPLEQQILLFAGRQLEDKKTIEDCGIKNGCQLFVRMNLRGD